MELTRQILDGLQIGERAYVFAKPMRCNVEEAKKRKKASRAAQLAD
jgi:hypothetical protein